MYDVSEQTSELSSTSTELASEIVAAYVASNAVPASELPSLIQSVHSAIAGLNSSTATSTAASVDMVAKPSPAEIRKSVRNDGIVSFIDGKTYKTLKRHLTSRGLDPRGYRDRYGLPADYPMVAPSYAEQRSALAKAIGLGRPGAMVEQTSKGLKAA